MGGAATLYRLIKLGDLPRFREKPTFSRPQGGRSRGGGWGGAEMGGRMGGRLSAYMGMRLGASSEHVELFIAKKRDFFSRKSV